MEESQSGPQASFPVTAKKNPVQVHLLPILLFQSEDVP